MLDGRDAQALHLVGVQDGRVVATCRVLNDGDTALLGRMAVAPDARRRGLASRLLAAAEAHARRERRAARRLGRPDRARSGCTSAPATPRRGERFLDAGIEHLMMDKRLR